MKKIIILAALGLALAGCSASGYVSATPEPTGPYTTQGIGGPGCLHSGPGWLTVLNTKPDGTQVPGSTYQVKDAYYCATTTGSAVIPATGKPFDLYLPFTFSSTMPGVNG